VPKKNMGGCRKTECDRVMGSVKKMDASVICVLSRHETIGSSEILLAGQQVVWGNEKYVQNLV
jgi:hypothetical protein